ncbi:MAG TPA: hypothetical protein VJL81_17790 [Solirubrobacterales bacterium]|nr:hypothetical protein [Solirubrobacterales bacterium]
MKRLSLTAAIGTILGAVVLAGCGGSSGGSTETSTTTASASGGGEQAKFEISKEDRQCLKEKGVELPEFKAGEGPQTFQKGEMPEPPEGGAMPGVGEAPEGAITQGGPPGAAMSEEDKEAFEECGVEMPEFKVGPGGVGGPNVNSAAFKKQVREYVACVRENGYELAEPNFSGEGPIFEKSESESSAFKKASAQCQSLLGGPQGASAEGATEES